MVKTVLLIPAPSDPLRLLGDGLCNATPPKVQRWACYAGKCSHVRWTSRRHHREKCHCEGEWLTLDDQEALALHLKGEPALMGLDRLKRRTGAMWPEDYIREGWWEMLVEGAEELGYGTIILLDIAGCPVDKSTLAPRWVPGPKPTTSNSDEIKQAVLDARERVRHVTEKEARSTDHLPDTFLGKN